MTIVDNALTLFTDQFRGAENLNALARCMLAPFLEIEQVQNDLLTQRWINTAVGQQLDGIGDIVGLARQGDDDETYRAKLKFQVFINTCQGTPEDMITATRFLTGGTFLRYFEHHPSAGFTIFTNGPTIITSSNVANVLYNLELDDGGLFNLEDGGELLLHPTEAAPNLHITLLSEIAPAGVDFISISYSLGEVPIFGFGNEASTYLLELDDTGLLEVDDGATSFLEVYTDQADPTNDDGFEGMAEACSFWELEVDIDNVSYGFAVSVNGVTEQLYLENTEFVDNTSIVGGGKMVEGIRDNG